MRLRVCFPRNRADVLVALPGAALAQSKAARHWPISRPTSRQVSAEVQSLKQEMNATGASGIQPAAGSMAQQRLDAIEAELQALNPQTEMLQNRINQVVARWHQPDRRS